jgi:type I restriction enzyme R subunit
LSPDTQSYSEDALVEQPAIALFAELGWETANCWGERFGEDGTLGRETPTEVVLTPRLRSSLKRLNPELPAIAIDLTIEELVKDRSLVAPAQANREIYQLLKNGVKVTVPSEEEGDTVEIVRVIDWNDPENNDFFLASQFWVTGEMYKRRADLVGFVNGLPLVFIELKASHQRLENAYRNNLRDYKNTIPQIFWYNAFVILSNGSESRIGSVTASWEHFAEWKKINSEGEEGRVSLETMIRGTCEKSRLLDIVENFTLFSEETAGLVKLVAKNHQYLGVNNAFEALKNRRENDGRLGVFWHTQGSGKSLSMVFFSQKVLRKLTGDWTFLIVTDRQELDDQIYKTFAACGAVTEGQVQAENGDHLKRLLRENHRNLFTLIQKFRTEGGERYPKLSDRSNIIVMTDEAHRSQYDVFAMNMREALPNAAFLGFTGTPLMAGEEKTKEVFGDYVSIYNFRQSVEDGATVPLYYENRIPELQLTNEALNEDLDRVIDEAMLDERQEQKLQREFNREYQLITREERLEKVAEDLVSHFMGRGQRGKAMVVSIDKATTIRMYDKVQKYWLKYLEDLREQLAGASSEEERKRLQEKISYMETTDMAVVVSQGQNEVEDMAKKGLDIRPHRERMIREDLETKFKDPQDPFRITFVCAMWMTGFDVPSVNTIYLDKPMRNHTLMQTIARANRVLGDKQNGLIVDYVGVFRDLERALAIYGSGAGGEVEEGETPVKDKEKLLQDLRGAVEETGAYLRERGVDPQEILDAEGFNRLKLLDDARDSVVKSDESKRQFLSLTSSVTRLYKAVLPDPSAGESAPLVKLFSVMAERIRLLDPEVDISEVMEGVSRVLDESITARSFVIPDSKDDQEPIDLSRIDFEELKKRFEQGRKQTEAEKLRGRVNRKLKEMVRLNKTRTDYQERLQKLIEEYNAGSLNINLYFAALIKMAQELSEEEQRAISEGLTEEELAVFDILTKPEMSLTDKEKEEVKRIARDLLETLKKEKLVLDWRKRQQARAAVKVSVMDELESLPPSYTDEMYERKSALVYQHIYDHYYGQGRSVYAEAG